MTYVLDGRDIATASAGLTTQERYTRELPKAPCIFCGETISHFNDGGVGWCVGAMVNGRPLAFLYCNQPACEQAARFDHEIWRCGCESDYVEMVGSLCTGCGRTRGDALPWDFENDFGTDRLTVENLRARVLADVYNLLPTKQIPLNCDVPYVNRIETLASTGEICTTTGRNGLRISRISQLPLESLVHLRRALTQYWKDHNVSPPRCSPSVAARLDGRPRKSRRS